MERLGNRKRTAFSNYKRAKEGALKKDVLNYWDTGNYGNDPVSQEELSILEDEWFKSQRKQREHILDMKTDRHGDPIPYEQLPQWIKDEYGEGHSYKGGPLEIRRTEDMIIDDFIEADNKYKMGE